MTHFGKNQLCLAPNEVPSEIASVDSLQFSTELLYLIYLKNQIAGSLVSQNAAHSCMRRLMAVDGRSGC
jgi:hypothetical protein